MTGRSTAGTTTPRTAAARSTAVRGGSATTPVHVSRPAPASPTRRTGPVHSRPQLRLVPAARTPVRTRRTEAPARRAPFVVLVVVLLVTTTLSLLLLNTAIAVDSLQVTQSRAANAEQAERVAELEQRVVTGGTAAELARAAAEEGLVPAGPAAHLVLGPGGESALRGTAEPAVAPDAETSGD